MSIDRSLESRHGNIVSGGGTSAGSHSISFKDGVTQAQIKSYIKDAKEGTRLYKEWQKKGKSARQAFINWRDKK